MPPSPVALFTCCVQQNSSIYSLSCTMTSNKTLPMRPSECVATFLTLQLSRFCDQHLSIVAQKNTLVPSGHIGLHLASYHPEGKALGRRPPLAVPIVLNRSCCIINNPPFPNRQLSRLRTMTIVGTSRACRIGRQASELHLILALRRALFVVNRNLAMNTELTRPSPRCLLVITLSGSPPPPTGTRSAERRNLERLM